jgi:NADPH-dependent 2,4-dienoyl-CoA reductase/sulfur reductase-like enzyme
VDVPGIDFENIITLRDIHESKYVVERIKKDAHVVCVGVSFTGMEAAAFCVKKVAKVTVIGRDIIPFRHSFGAEVGGAILKFFKDNKVEFEMKNGVKRCIGNVKGEITSVELNDGKILKCDLLILACGGYLNTGFLKDSGVNINQNGSIDTDEYLQTNVEGVYVGGDIANSPIYMTGKNENIGHYPLAQYHGKIAAVNMCGIPRKLQAVPFFWTMLFGRSFRFAGHGKIHETRIEGNLELLRFVAFYFDDMGQVIAMSSCGRDPVVAQYAELLSQGRYLMKSDIEEDPFAWTQDIAVSTCKWEPDENK